MKKIVFTSITTINPPVHLCAVCMAAEVKEKEAKCGVCASNPIIIEFADQSLPWRNLLIFVAVFIVLFGIVYLIRS